MKRTVMGLVALGLVSFLARSAAAQADPEIVAVVNQVLAGAQVDASGYKTLVAPPSIASDVRKQQEFLRNVRNVLADKEPWTDGTRSLLNNYYLRYFFTLFTKTDAAALEKLPEERYKFLKDHLEFGKNSPGPHNHLVDLTLATMSAIARDPEYHPAVRYNAVYLVGQLNDTETDRSGAEPRTPEPTARALTLQLEIFKDQAKYTDELRVAALLGIVRQFEWEPFRLTNGPLPPPQRADAVAQLTALASAKAPPASRTAGGHAWMRKRALEALAFSAYSKPDPAVCTLVETILADAAEPLLVRCAAAEALGRLNYAAPAKMNPQPLAQKLAELAIAICRSEFDRLDALRKEEERLGQVAAGAVPGVGGPGDIAGGPRQGVGPVGPLGPGGIRPPAGPSPDELYALAKIYRLDPVRRRLRAQLYAVQLGLGFPLDKTKTRPGGPAPATAGTTLFRGCHGFATKPAERIYIEDVLTEVNKLGDTIEKTNTELFALRNDLQTGLANLEKLVLKGGAAPPPAQPGEDPAAPASAAAAVTP